LPEIHLPRLLFWPVVLMLLMVRNAAHRPPAFRHSALGPELSDGRAHCPDAAAAAGGAEHDAGRCVLAVTSLLFAALALAPVSGRRQGTLLVAGTVPTVSKLAPR
jgi:hypothetical protein